MKANMEEFEECFGFDLEPETMEEAIMLARFGINKTKTLADSYVSIYRNGRMTVYINIGKKKREVYELGGAAL